jgi:multiple sugar transport system substrate-binding protein
VRRTAAGGSAVRRTAARRRALRRTAAVAVCLLLAACSGGSGAAPRPTSGGGDIVVASGLDVTSTDVRQQLIAQWNRTPEGRKHPARLVELPGDADQQSSQLLGALQSGSSQYDVVNLDVTWVPEFAAAGLITPLDPLSSDFIPSVAGTAAWRGTTYAAPFNSDVGLLYYRPDYLNQVGIDPANYPTIGTTWSQLQSLIRTLDDHTAPAGYQAGWTTQLDAYEGLTVNTVEAFATAGVQLTDSSGHYTGTPEKLRTGLEALRTRTDNQYTLRAALGSREAASLSDFAAGRTAFLRHWPYAYQSLPQSLPDNDVAVAPLPGSAVLGGQDLAVSAASPRAAYAAELVRFLTGAASERCLLDAGLAATRTSAYADPRVTCGLPQSSPSPAPGRPSGEGQDMPRDAQGRPAYALPTLLPALKGAVQRPRTPYYSAFTQALQSVVHGWLANQAPPDTDQVARQLDKALAESLSGR